MKISGLRIGFTFAAMAILLAACGRPGTPPAVPTQPLTPAIRLHPAAARPGEQIMVEGVGFPPHSAVVARLESLAAPQARILIARINTNGIGAFKLLFTLPAMWSDGALITDTALVVAVGAAGSPDEVAIALVFEPATSVPEVAELVSEPTPEPSPEPASTPTDMQAPAATLSPTLTAFLAVEPAIGVEPASGSGGTQVRVSGSGFPANSLVVIRLGVPENGAYEHVYAQANSDADGNIDVTFEMPAIWQDGRTISEMALLIIASVADGIGEAVANYTYVPSLELAVEATTSETPQPAQAAVYPSPSSPDPVQTSIDFLSAVINDPYGSGAAGYLSRKLQAELRAGKSMLDVMNLPSVFYRFEVVILSSGTENILVQATLDVAGNLVQRTLLLVREGEGDNWRVDGVQ